MKQLNHFLLLAFIAIMPLNVFSQVLVEAESFKTKGGWKLDHQAFPQIGSAYLLAHGSGRVVADAQTIVDFKEKGDYHVYVSTYNWTSPWYKGEGPGKFKIIVNGKPLENTLGSKGDKWEWQYAGKTNISSSSVKLVLRDLTGFEGRVDAIYFSKVKKTPPTGIKELESFRNKSLGYFKPKNGGEYDLVVVGGGVAGCCTALTAARYGLNVALVDNLPGVGGNHYLSVKMNGLLNKNLYPNVGNMLRQLSDLVIPSPEEYANEKHVEHFNGAGNVILKQRTSVELALFRKKVLESAGVKLFQSTHVYEAVANKGKIKSVQGKSLITGEPIVFNGRLFADCTGDGVVGYLVGADYRIGREARTVANESLAPEVADQKKMGSTLWWNVKKKDEKVSFPTLKEMPWAMQCSDEYFHDVCKGGWFWETGMTRDNALEMELVRDNLFRAIYGNWAYIKEHKNEEHLNEELNVTSYIGMKRESRRLLGDIILNENDIRNRVKYPDASFTTTWPLDLHYATEDNAKYFPGWEWITKCDNDKKSSWVKPPYDVPYRVLYSRNIDNLFIGGRNMSVTHVALGTVRVQGTLGMAGEVIGMAANICIKHNAEPRDVYKKYLNELIESMKKGAPLE